MICQKVKDHHLKKKKLITEYKRNNIYIYKYRYKKYYPLILCL